MSIFDAIGDLFSNEADHIGQLTNSLVKKPLPALLGAEDPVGAKLWGGLTGKNFEPQVNVFGGETNTQFRTSQSRGVNTTMSRDLGYVADAIALYEGGSYAYEALGAGGAAGAAGGAAGGAGGGTAMGGAAGALGAADSSAASAQLGLTAADVGGTSGATAGAGSAAGAGAGASSSWWDYGKTAAKLVGPSLLNAAMQPKPPKTKAPTAMPDPLAQEQAQRQKLIEQLSRRGRASTILTSATNGSLGG